MNQHSVKIDASGQVKIEGDSVAGIKEKYRNLREVENEDQHNQKVYERIQGKTKMSAHIYRFKGCISECFEPYLKQYSDTEENKISEAV